MNRILVIASHPDDEILGCEGTIARFRMKGADIGIVLMGEGRGSLLDNEFDSVSLLEHIKKIEKNIETFKPNIIFTHFRNDLNIDHRITYQAVITATRPMKDCPVNEIYSFEIPSSTEWNYPTSFSPNVFFDITDTIHLKLKAMEKYETELREWPHPRSLTGIRALAEYRGMSVGMQCAEAFEAVRILK